jgi:hypothetical protein
LGLDDQYSSNIDLMTMGRTPLTPLTPSTVANTGGWGEPQTPYETPQTFNNSWRSDSFDTSGLFSSMPATPSMPTPRDTSLTPGQFQTPLTSDLQNYDDENWLIPDIEVIVEHNEQYKGLMGLVLEARGSYCRIQLYVSPRDPSAKAQESVVVDLDGSCLVPVRPERLDKVIVIKGDLKGQRGTVANLVDMTEAIVKLDQNEIKIIKLDYLARTAELASL